MKAVDLKQQYLDYFKSKGHVIIPSAPLIPENDPTVLFTTAGMHPLVPFLVGQPHPLGKRLVDVQKCLRTDDIDEVGDNVHHTFFQMLGNWSLGDYFKKEAIEMSFEFLTKILKIPLDRLAVTCFAGDKDAPKDEESARTWLKQGIPTERIAFLPKKDNWWGPAGEAGPCGPCTEIFYWSDPQNKAPKVFNPKDQNWVEIGNDVLLEYNKTKEGKFLPLKQRNVDFGGGVERTTAILQGFDDNYRTELFWPIIQDLEEITQKSYTHHTKAMRIIADHIRAAVFILGDERGVVPSNVDQGYILRRFIRRIIRQMRALGVKMEDIFITVLAERIIKIYAKEYPLLKEKEKFIKQELEKEEEKFKKTLENGLKEFEKMASKSKEISGKDAFLLFQSYGFPIEITQELAAEKGIKVDVGSFKQEFEKHQELSRVGAEQKFKGGLSEANEQTTKLHTATHLLNEALRKVVSKDIHQKGSNITPERLRFDFNFDRKLTDEELKKVEDEVNRMIKTATKVVREEMPVKEAFAKGTHGEFGARYPERVSVYTIGTHSKEICMGPHVQNTKELSHFKIQKEESVAAGIRRIKAILISL
ncbi:MAG: alanine--tRNA ligase [Candidatus Woesearchaeota archaeon]